ncbi:hypothetical protein C8J57DRAFT_1726036 [Mycena rebaudengoi]|nr:hypothetical protein C8J57DRAFT_1726036 [Mycena rebaudengoi]
MSEVDILPDHLAKFSSLQLSRAPSLSSHYHHSYSFQAAAADFPPPLIHAIVIIVDLPHSSLGCSLSRSSNTCSDPVEPSTSLFTLKAETMLVLVESLLIPSPTRYSKFCFDWSRVKILSTAASSAHDTFASNPVTMAVHLKISDGSPTLSKTKAMPMYLEQNHFSKAVNIAVLLRGSWDSEATMSTLLWMIGRCYFYLIFAYREISDGITRPLKIDTMAVYLEPQIYAPESRNYCCIARSHAVPFP